MAWQDWGWASSAQHTQPWPLVSAPENLPRAFVHFSVDIRAPTCPARTSQAPGEDRRQMRAGAPVWVGCVGLLEPLGMGTEGQGQTLGVRPVSVRVAMPLGEQMVLLAPCPLFLSTPPPQPACRAGAQLLSPPQSRARAGLGEVTAAAPKAWGRGVGGAASRAREGIRMRRGLEGPEWLGNWGSPLILEERGDLCRGC